MDAGLVIETPYCTQQTAVLTRGMTLRAIHAAEVNRIGKTRCCTLPVQPHDIACNTLPCSFTPLGLPTQMGLPPYQARGLALASPFQR